MDDPVKVATFCILIGGFLGWLFAYSEIATECQRQGSFYVGSKDFVCNLKDGKNG